MKEIIKFFKPDYLIRIEDDEENRVYMFDVTTKKVYFHRQQLHRPNGMIGAVVATSLSGAGINWLRLELYLNDPSFVFKMSLVLASIVLSFLILWLMIKKTKRLQVEEYRKKHVVKQVKQKEEIKKVLSHAKSQVLLVLFLSIGLLIWSIIVFHRFFTNENLATYFWASILFLVFTLSLLNIPRLALLSTCTTIDFQE